MSVAPERLVAMLAKDQASAAATTSRNASRLSPSGRSRPIRTSPAAASRRPNNPRGDGRSPSHRAAMRMVKNTWLCSTSDDSPAGMPWAMPTNSRPNLTTPRSTPISRMRPNGAGIGPRRTNSGSAARAKRRAQNSSGGKSPRPTLITTKFRPQIRVTSRASRICATGMAASGKLQATLAVASARVAIQLAGKNIRQPLTATRAAAVPRARHAARRRPGAAPGDAPPRAARPRSRGAPRARRRPLRLRRRCR